MAKTEPTYTLAQVNAIGQAAQAAYGRAIGQAIMDVCPDLYDQLRERTDWHLHQAAARAKAKGDGTTGPDQRRA